MSERDFEMVSVHKYPHRQHNYRGYLQPRTSRIAAPRCLDANILVQGINQGQRLARIVSLGSNCFVSAIQDHLTCRDASQLCWQCLNRSFPGSHWEPSELNPIFHKTKLRWNRLKWFLWPYFIGLRHLNSHTDFIRHRNKTWYTILLIAPIPCHDVSC